MKSIKKHIFGVATAFIILATVVTVLLLDILPVNYKSSNTNTEIKAQMVERLMKIAEKRGEVSYISFTPFVWDEGYYIDYSADKTTVNNLSDNKIDFMQLNEYESRWVFFYKGQLIVDLITKNDEIDCDITPRKFDKTQWLSIETNNTGIVTLFD